MKRINIYTYCLAGSVMIMAAGACQKDTFVDVNTDNETITEIDPENQFLNAVIISNDGDFEWFYDKYRRIMPWMQLNTGNAGNDKAFTREAGNFNQRYGHFYSRGNIGAGGAIADMLHIIDNMPEEEQAKRLHQRNIAKIVMTEYAFYVSDINGSIVYQEAFQGRYMQNFTPVYDAQAALFDIWDQDLKNAIGVLSSSPGEQIGLGDKDLYFNGDPESWIRAANSLRLRIAMRLMKRDPGKMQAIVNEVLADGRVINSNEQNWQLIANASFSSGGNFNPEGFRAPKPNVDFMWEHKDPRIAAFYTMNDYTEENFNLAKQQGKLPAGATWSPRQYVGSFTSPDAAASATNTEFYTLRNIMKDENGDGTPEEVGLDTLSNIQPRLFQPAYETGTGIHYFPRITYANVCFMRAELATRGITSENAEEWYNKGVEASLWLYDKMAQEARIEGYIPVTEGQVAAYMAMEGIAYDPSKALDQISSQAYLDFYKQANEAWALWKRTGMPNENTVLSLPRLVADGAVLPIPRRAAISFPSSTERNFENKSAAIEAMSQDPDFGSGPEDIFGRVWWDMSM